MNDLRHIKVPTVDGMWVKFPISNHILDAKKARVAFARARTWRPSLMQQGASFALMLALWASSYGITYGTINPTLSYFRDSELSRNNIFKAGLLDFRVNPGHEALTIEEGGSVFLLPLMEPFVSSFPIMYRVHVEETADPSPLCALLEAHATTSPFLYDGKLALLSTGTTTTSGHWGVDVALPSAPDLVDGATCDVDFVYSGWDKDAPEGTGYTDEERHSFTFIFSKPVPESVAEEPPVAPQDVQQDESTGGEEDAHDGSDDEHADGGSEDGESTDDKKDKKEKDGKDDKQTSEGETADEGTEQISDSASTTEEVIIQ